MMEWDELCKKIHNCQKCPISTGITQKVIHKGSLSPKILFIGEAPGYEEDKQGLPFVGRSGKLLDEWVSFLEIKDYAIINVIKCRPPDNRNPTEDEILNCHPFFEDQIKILKPEIIVCLGKFSMTKMVPELKGQGIMKNAGKFYHNNKIYVAPHPAFFLRNQNLSWKKFLLELKSHLHYSKKKKIEKIIVDTPEKFKQFISEVNKPEIAYDTECTGLDIQKLKIVGMSFYTGENKSWYLPLNHNTQEPQLDQNRIGTEIERVFKESKVIIGHNLSYDMQVIKKEIDVYPEKQDWFDTMIAAHLLNENMRKSLKELSIEILGERMTTFKEVAKEYDIQNSSISETAKYACDDAIQTFKLYKKFKQPLIDQNLGNLFYNIEMPFLRCIIDMEQNGVLVDREKIKEYDEKVKKLIIEYRNKIWEIVGEGKKAQMSLFGGYELTGPDLNSPKQLGDLLYRDLKLQAKVLSKKTGIPSTGVQALKAIEDDHEVVPLILKYRKYQKLSTAYLSSLPKFISNDKRIHCRFNPIGTVTGRLSSDSPNLQQLPRSEEIDIRGCFIVPKGKKFLAIDFSQQELRLAAYFSKDPKMIEAYQKGYDLHLSNANDIFHLNLSQKELTDGTPEHDEAKKENKKFRNQAKTIVSFGILYGMGKYSLSERLKVSIEEADQLINKYFDSFPKVKQSINNAYSFIKKHGYMINHYRRRRRFDLSDYENLHDQLKQGYNFLIQGTAADMLKDCMIRVKKFIDENNKECKMLFTVHDEICFEIPEEKAEFYKTKIMNIMENTLDIIPQLLTDGNYGDNYSQAK